MEIVLEHLKENVTLYVFGAVVLAPAIYFTRKWSLPTILYSIEIVLYCTIMHVVVWLLVVCGKWFKESTSMKALRADRVPADSPDWATPLVEFWVKELYSPEWIAWVEVGLLFLIFVLVWRYRPPKVKRKPRRASASKPGSKPGSMMKNPRKYPTQGGGGRR